MSQVDPYQPPSADVSDVAVEEELAGRGTRLGATMLDAFIYTLAMIPAFIALVQAENGSDPNMMLLGLGGLLVLGVFGYNLYLLAENGWTIGKKLLGIRIVRSDYQKVGVARVVFLRQILPGVVGNIPVLGTIFTLANPLFIFRQDRRCIHDHIADTIVIIA